MRTVFNRERRQAIAESEIERVVRSLPLPLREAASRVAILCFPRPDPSLVEPDGEEVLLGLFEGETTNASTTEGFNLPPQISLFFENIWDMAEGDPATYREEIRVTLLHELGHYLGLDEEDLDLRGLG